MLVPLSTPGAYARWVNLPRIILSAQTISVAILTCVFISSAAYLLLPSLPVTRFAAGLFLLVALGALVLAGTAVLALLDRYLAAQRDHSDRSQVVFEELRQIALTAATPSSRNSDDGSVL